MEVDQTHVDRNLLKTTTKAMHLGNTLNVKASLKEEVDTASAYCIMETK